MMYKCEVMIVLQSLQVACTNSEMWITSDYINNLPAVWQLKDAVTEAHVLHELA